MTTDLYLFRHGQTDWNAQRRYQGHTDIPLNKLGRKQAETLIELVKPLRAEIVLSSDLSRALETAKIAFQGSQIPIYSHPELREANVGDAEGKLITDIFELYGEDSWQRWISKHPEDQDFSYPGGETKLEHLNRIKSFLENFIQNNSYQKIAVSTHGGSLFRLVHHCQNAPEEAISIRNCEAYHLQYADNKWHYIQKIENSLL